MLAGTPLYQIVVESNTPALIFVGKFIVSVLVDCKYVNDEFVFFTLSTIRLFIKSNVIEEEGLVILK